MDVREFETAQQQEVPEPDLDTLIRRFQYAFEATDGDTDSAMAALNELLPQPIRYEEFLGRLRSEP